MLKSVQRGLFSATLFSASAGAGLKQITIDINSPVSSHQRRWQCTGRGVFLRAGDPQHCATLHRHVAQPYTGTSVMFAGQPYHAIVFARVRYAHLTCYGRRS